MALAGRENNLEDFPDLVDGERGQRLRVQRLGLNYLLDDLAQVRRQARHVHLAVLVGARLQRVLHLLVHVLRQQPARPDRGRRVVGLRAAARELHEGDAVGVRERNRLLRVRGRPLGTGRSEELPQIGESLLDGFDLNESR